MMKKLFRLICFPFLHVNNNVYTFLSGIAISLATNIFTTICIDDIGFTTQWNLYVSTLAFAMISAILLYMATKMSGFQSFAYSPTDNFDKEVREIIVLEATEDDYKKWLLRFFILFVLIIIGIAFLVTDFSWLITKLVK